MKRLFSLALAASLAAGGVAAKDDGDRLDDFVRTGEMQDCVPMRSTDITAIDDSTLLFRVGAGKYYLNEVSKGCHDADSGFTRLELKLFGSQLCQKESVKVVESSTGMFTGACILGPFERLEKKQPEAAATDG